MSIHNPGQGGGSEAAAAFHVPPEAGVIQVEQPKHAVGDEYADQFGALGSEDFTEAKNAEWIDENNQLTSRGVAQLESRKPEIVEKPKYVVKDAYSDSWGWGPIDDFNEDYKGAKKKDWIDDKDRLTPAGVAELLRADAGKKSASKIDPAQFVQTARLARKKQFVLGTSYAVRPPEVEQIAPGKSVANLEKALRKTEEAGADTQAESREATIKFLTQLFSKFSYSLDKHTLTEDGFDDAGEGKYKFYAEWSSDNGGKGKKTTLKRTFKGTFEEINSDLEDWLSR